MADVPDIIAHCPLFKNYSNLQIREFLAGTGYSISRYKKNQLIFRMDQQITHVGIILTGSVEVQKIFQSGRLINLIYKEKGEIIAEGTVFSSMPTYPCQVSARETTDILLLPRQCMLRVLGRNPSLLTNLLQLMSDKLVMLNTKIELLSYCSIQSKIAFSLLYCIKAHPAAQVIELPYSKKTWAEHLNVPRPSLCRELKNLCRSDIIRINKRTITIVNRDHLERMLNG
ncbi:Crp/Fnr family transcriptional regulator|uniref:cAMP-binding domain of CRP or a regulatory subunit of cAMP-dependent protein kinases n=1 Tax=Dendrosporobacter quercicolus TaxID=146817 RepID=A0A1G9XJ47_9FIRM|nr:Crp/Fnr family transcriptional regulator [Dendrosporobacter quercicolus]NSL49661.1 Crp/Fnr family transcriptional regulator [Dendrosporobacter quercicolus DSM 1736]SDM96255.1 cAMP-binding domain of CRP or a regulatory subunit of cAMP-dependent protein kinases [Dendrosporobacter quercicolus]